MKTVKNLLIIVAVLLLGLLVMNVYNTINNTLDEMEHIKTQYNKLEIQRQLTHVDIEYM